VADLHAALNDPEARTEAAEIERWWPIVKGMNLQEK
jgi:hypothetical protein